jgi:hypothetical protein
LIPQLLTILSPNLRSVSSEVFSKEEKLAMANMVDTLQLFGLSYAQTYGDGVEVCSVYGRAMFNRELLITIVVLL